MIDENKIRRDIMAADDDFLDRLTCLLRAYDYEPLNLLARYVADLCDVDIADMFSSIDRSHFSQARWLFWYAYRYITKESFARIAERTVFDGHSFGWRGVAAGITNMSVMIERDSIWKKRWAITKRLIIARHDAEDEFIKKIDNQPIKVTLSAPKGTKIELKEI